MTPQRVLRWRRIKSRSLPGLRHPRGQIRVAAFYPKHFDARLAVGVPELRDSLHGRGRDWTLSG